MKLFVTALLISIAAFAQTPTMTPVYSTATANWQIKPIAVACVRYCRAGCAHFPRAHRGQGSCTAGARHLWAVTFINAAGETTIGTASTVQTLPGASATEGLTAIPLGPAGTTGRNVYRTLAGTTTPYALDCASAPCIANNTATTFSDTLADGSSSAAPPSSNTTGRPYAVVSVDGISQDAYGEQPHRRGTNTFSVCDEQASPICRFCPPFRLPRTRAM